LYHFSLQGDVSNTQKPQTDGNSRPRKKAKVAAQKKESSNEPSENEQRDNSETIKENVKAHETTSTKRRVSARLLAMQERERKASLSADSTKSSSSGSKRSKSKPRTSCKKDQFLEFWLRKDTILTVSQFKLRPQNFKPTIHTEGLAPFDIINKNDDTKVSNYITDICQHLFQKEVRIPLHDENLNITFTYGAEEIIFHPCLISISFQNEFHPGKYIDRQVDINSKMRAILVDWLVEVHMKFRLVPETLYLCINIIDRYCALKSVTRSRLQLVGVTALLVACKYEEIYPPEVRDCVYITDRAYLREQVLNMEQDILKTLNWKLTVPTAYPFLLRFIQIVNATELQAHAANYYMERTLQEHELLMYPPSLVCAAAVVLSLNNADIYRAEKIKNPTLPGIPTVLLEYTDFSQGMLLKCAEEIARYVAEEPITASRRQLIAVKKKFENKKYGQVSSDIRNPVYQDLADACIRNPH